MSWLSDIKFCLSSLSRRVTIIEEGGGGGGTADFASPPAIGNVAPNTGKFTTLQATLGLNVSGGTMAFNTATFTFGTGSASAFRTSLGLGSLATQSTVTSSQISDSTSYGRDLLTGASVAAQRTSLGLGSLATQSPTGTPSSTTYLRGDNTWATVAAGGFIGTTNRILVGGSGTNADSNLETTIATTGVNASVNSVVLNVPTAVGTTHTNLVLTPKGTNGSIIFGPVPDGGSSGGNARGPTCLDLQITRNAASQVTRSLNGLAIGGGNTTDNSYTYSTAIGWGNTCSGANSLAVGSSNQALSPSGFAFGQSNQLNGTSSMAFGYGNFAQPGAVSGNVGIAVGYSNKSNGNNSITLGLSCEALGALSFAYGSGAISTRIGQHSGATGNFSDNGDCQRVNFLLRKKITNSAAATELALDGGTNYLTIPSGKGMAFVVHVYGMKSDKSQWAYFVRKASIISFGTGIALYPTVPLTVGTDDNLAGCGLLIEAVDATADYLSIKVTNPTGTEVWRWMAHVEGVEMVYGI